MTDRGLFDTPFLLFFRSPVHRAQAPSDGRLEICLPLGEKTSTVGKSWFITVSGGATFENGKNSGSGVDVRPSPSDLGSEVSFIGARTAGVIGGREKRLV